MRRLLSFAAVSLVLGTVGLSAPAGSLAATTRPVAFSGLGFLQHFIFKHVCSAPAAGHAACDAILATPSTASGTPTATNVSPAVKPLVTPAPPYGPANLLSAYNLPGPTAAGSPGTGETVAIVDAYNDPDAANDLATYRTNYGLSPCTVANGCFKQVGQTGGAVPSNNASWSQEISLDLDMVSAICPNCHILLVEASSSSQANLGAAVNEAAALGATQISNSYGGSESSSEVSQQSAYDHPGIDITASSGDDGYGVEFPAASQYVTAVGGTSLTPSSNARGWTESVWSTSSTEGAGSGCSAYIPKPSWQTDTGCSKRTVADVSADADPATGVAVYDSYAYQGASGWLQFGGTSVASPLIASVDALAGGRAKGAYSFGQYPYLNASQFYDVTTGSNGSCSATAAYLCTAEIGYDGPTGIGTPDGAAPITPPTAPVNSVPPSIVGSPVVGQTLTGYAGTWSGSPTFTYTWNSCSATLSCTVVGSGSGSTATYVPTTPGDVGHTITITFNATNSIGSTSATSIPVGPVTLPPSPVNTGSPSITGSPVVGQTLTGSAGSWSGSPTFTYTWNSCPTSTPCTVVASGSGSTASYAPLASDVGHTITITFTATNAGGSTSATSTPTAAVTAAPPPSFSITASPASQSVSAGSSASYTVTVNRVNGFAGSVALSASGLPTGVTASFSPNPTTTTTSTLTLKSTRSSPTGAHTIGISGASTGFPNATTSVSLTLTSSCFIFCF
jgi:subtilase family serine protease